MRRSQDHTSVVEKIGTEAFATHSIVPPQAGRFTIARYSYDLDGSGEDDGIALPFSLKESHSIEGSVCKILIRFEISRKIC